MPHAAPVQPHKGPDCPTSPLRSTKAPAAPQHKQRHTKLLKIPPARILLLGSLPSDHGTFRAITKHSERSLNIQSDHKCNTFCPYVRDPERLQRGIWGEKLGPPQNQYFETTYICQTYSCGHSHPKMPPQAIMPTHVWARVYSTQFFGRVWKRAGIYTHVGRSTHPFKSEVL